MLGTTLSHYHILREVGRGAMGQIYLARDTRLNRNVALKMLPPALVSDERRRRRFDRESKALAALNHPNVVTIHSVEEVDGQPFLVMEWIQGRSLEELISPGGLPLERYLELAIPLIEAVSQAHQAGIIHRDLKPANIMVRDDGVLKVLDFGISRIEQETMIDGHAGTESLTAEGLVVGTLPYMAPEQLEGRPVDPRSDIFSLGIILYEMAAGVRPFYGGSSASLVSSILRDDPLPLSGVREALPSALEAIVARCLAKRPQDRFQTAAELRQALRALQRELELGTAATAAPAPWSSSASALSAATAPTLTSATSITLPSVPTLPTLQAPVTSVAPGRLRRRLPLLAALAVVVIGMVVAAGLFWRGREHEGTAAPSRPPNVGTVLPAAARPAVSSIAVLPLRNLSGDPGQEFFSDGTTEAVIANLAKIGGLRVTSRNAVMRYKSQQTELPQIARELGVDYLLEGSLLRSGDELMIIVQLVDPKTDSTVVWGDSYRGSLGDVFAFQQQVAEAVARQTKGELTAADLSRLGHVQQVAPEVYETYLKARYLLHQRTPDALQQALALVDRALERDPTYALGWATQAECYLYLTIGGISALPPQEGLPKAREAALRALDLDESLSEAHAALAFAHLQNWEWNKVERGFRRALELNPSNADAYLKFSLFLTARKRHDEAIAAVETARRLDPHSVHIRITYTGMSFLARRYEAAAESARAAIALQPDHWLPHYHLGTILSFQGKPREAEAELREALRLSQGDPLALAALARQDALAGRTASARRIVAELEAASQRDWIPPSTLASPLFALGEVDRAFEWLEKGVDVRDQQLVLLDVHPFYDPYRSDLRFQRLLAEVGLKRG
ncbi:MAG TPA: protein kinase [Thermoanaerobaculia bacterium]|nr:protein kinase [Thermoanaerobaculia bacterium]